MLPVLLVSDQSERRAHLRRTCCVIVLTVCVEAACWQHKFAGRRPMLMMPAAKSDATRKTPHSCVLISANAACSCGETSEKRTYLL